MICPEHTLCINSGGHIATLWWPGLRFIFEINNNLWWPRGQMGSDEQTLSLDLAALAWKWDLGQVCVCFGIVSSSLERWLVLVAAVLACLKAEKKSNFRAVLDGRVGPQRLLPKIQGWLQPLSLLYEPGRWSQRVKNMLFLIFFANIRNSSRFDCLSSWCNLFPFLGKVGVGVSNGM